MSGTEKPEEFAEKYIRQKGWWQKFIETLGVVLVTVGAISAIWQYYDDSTLFPIALLLAGIAFLLIELVVYVEGIHVDLEYLQIIVEERRAKENDQ